MSEESDVIGGGTTVDEADEWGGREPTWWSALSLFTPEARALAALVLASSSLVLIGNAGVIATTIQLGRSISVRRFAAEPIVHLCVAAVALALALSAIRADWEDDDDNSRWTGPVARAAVIVAVVSIVVAAVALGFTLTAGPPSFGG